jgi:hypothetical protein
MTEQKNHKWYVTMTDKFMSGWGQAQGKINKLVIECDTLSEAQTVENNANRRHEMIYVNVVDHKPSYNSNRYMVSWHDKTDYKNWFSEQYDWA